VFFIGIPGKLGMRDCASSISAKPEPWRAGMKKPFSNENAVPGPKGDATDAQASICSRELAIYIAEMLKSLRTCAKSPDLRTLEALLGAAEAEARNVVSGKSGKG
jgi:hypothetical protein